MKKLLIPALILCLPAAGCRSAEKTTGKTQSDSTASLSAFSRTETLLADSRGASGSLRFDSLVVEIRFDSAQRVVGKRYTVSNLEESRHIERKTTAGERDTSTVVNESETAMRSETKVFSETNGTFGKIWNCMALMILGLTAVLFYRVFRG